MKHIYYHYHKLQFHPDRYLPTRIYLFGCEPICGLNPFQAVRSGHIKKITHHLIVTGASMCVVSHPAIIDQVCSSSPPFPPSSPPSLLPLPLPPLFSSCSTTSSSSFRFLLLHCHIFLPLQVFGTVHCYRSICTGLTGSVQYPSSRLQFLITNYPDIKR